MSVKIYVGYKYNGTYQELEKDILHIREQLDYSMRDLTEDGKISEYESFAPCFVVNNIEGGLYLHLLGIKEETIKPYLSERFEDFRYRDNTDKDENISDEDWYARGFIRCQQKQYIKYDRQ